MPNERGRAMLRNHAAADVDQPGSGGDVVGEIGNGRFDPCRQRWRLRTVAGDDDAGANQPCEPGRIQSPGPGPPLEVPVVLRTQPEIAIPLKIEKDGLLIADAPA